MSFKKTKTEEKANPPVAKVRVGLVTAAIWEKATDNGTFYNVTFERRYKDKDGNWHSTQSYDAYDLLNLAKAADLAHTQILEAMEDDRNSETTEG